MFHTADSSLDLWADAVPAGTHNQRAAIASSVGFVGGFASLCGELIRLIGQDAGFSLQEKGALQGEWGTERPSVAAFTAGPRLASCRVSAALLDGAR